MVLPISFGTFPNYYIPRHFKAEELVSEVVFHRLQHYNVDPWLLFDPRVLITIDALHEHYNEKILINDWVFGGTLQQCGYRGNDCTIGATFSQHKLGRACDLHFEKTSADQVRKDCLSNMWSEPFKYITCVEIGVSWFHFDTRNYDKATQGILQVSA